MAAPTPTIARLAKEVYDSMADNDAGSDEVTAYVQDAVTSMTTNLFQMVVDDNALGFLDWEYAGEDSPAAVLRSAIVEAVASEVEELLESGQDDSSEDDAPDPEGEPEATPAAPFDIMRHLKDKQRGRLSRP